MGEEERKKKSKYQKIEGEVVLVAFLQVWATEVIDLNFTPAIDRAAFAVGYPLYQSIAGSIIIGYLLSW